MTNRTLCIVLLLAGCGGGSGTGTGKTVQITCDVQTAAIDTCTVGVVEQTKADDYTAACVEVGGTVSTDPCARPNSFGVCNDVKSDGVVASVTSYSSSSMSTVAGAMTACDNQGGTFVANSAYTAGFMCGNTSYCAQFGALTSAQVADADSYCAQASLPAATHGACTTSPAVGTCATKTTTVGAVTIYFYGSASDAGGDQAVCTSDFNGVWTAGS